MNGTNVFLFLSGDSTSKGELRQSRNLKSREKVTEEGGGEKNGRGDKNKHIYTM